MARRRTKIGEPRQESERVLWRRFLESREVRARDELVGLHLTLARSVLGKFCSRWPRSMDWQALESAAYGGLVRAVERFDPNRGASFTSYATRRIRGALLDAARELSRKSRREFLRQDTACEARAQLAHSLGRRPNGEELLEHTGLPDRPVTGKLLSIDQELYGQEISVAMILEDTANLDGGRYARDAFFAEITRDLEIEAKLILWAYYLVGRSMREIGEFLGVSESRISQRHSQAMKSLRSRLDAGETWELWASRACW